MVERPNYGGRWLNFFFLLPTFMDSISRLKNTHTSATKIENKTKQRNMFVDKDIWRFEKKTSI